MMFVLPSNRFSDILTVSWWQQVLISGVLSTFGKGKSFSIHTKDRWDSGIDPDRSLVEAFLASLTKYRAAFSQKMKGHKNPAQR